MKISIEEANKIFDIIANEGKHPQRYIDSYREEFVRKFAAGDMYEHWYPTDAGSSIKVYFQQGWANVIGVRFYAQTINTVHDKTLVEDAHKALAAAGFTVY